MKKVLSSAVVLGVLASGAYADSYIEVGGSSASIDGTKQSGGSMDLGFGSRAKAGAFGHQAGMNIDFVNSKSNSDAGNVGYIKYQPNYGITDSLRVFANIGYGFQSLGLVGTGSNKTTVYATGMGYGAGLTYDITDSFSIYAAYKTMTLSYSTIPDYDYKSTTAGIMYNFGKKN